MSDSNRVGILETTLRDGSYAINFQFTAADTAALCRALEDAGCDRIEVGHGVGLGASEKGLGVAAETDEAYCRAAASTLKRARFGMFCIPGIATLDHVDLAASLGMGFIRIGTNVTQVPDSKPFIERARRHGMFVCSNFMKSYAVDCDAFAEQVKRSVDYGTEMVYLVDSAGGMLPEDVTRYVETIRRVSDIPWAFHGHDNLGLAIGNSLHAIRLGAAVVDTSLQGMGRSAGNAATELLVAAVRRAGLDPGIDLIKILDAGEKYIRPLLTRTGLHSLDVIAGYAQFHSSYMGTIRKFSAQYQVDPRQLMIGVAAENRIDAPHELVERLARKLAATGEVYLARYEFYKYYGAEQEFKAR